MLSFFKRQATRSLNHLNRIVDERKQSFNVWDKILLVASAATSIVLRRSPWLILANISVLGVSALLPRTGGNVIEGETESPYADLIHAKLDEIFNQAEKFNKPLKRPDRIVFRDQNRTSVDMYASTTRNNQHVLIVSGNVSLMSDGALTIMIEHELSHIQLGDTKAFEHPDRMFVMGAFFAALGSQANLFSSLSWVAGLFILKQTSLRHRERRADHYAVQNSAEPNDVNRDKLKDLEHMVTQLEQQREKADNLDVADVAAESYAKQLEVYVHKARNRPNTILEHVTNLGVNLVSTHPTAAYRIKI
jgi:Zn-dependent protease with chaperone function